VLNAPVDAVDVDAALGFVREYVRTATSPGYILAVNSEKAYALLVNPRMREFFDTAALLIPDGIGLVLAVRMLFGRKIGRVPGADLMQKICREAPRMGYRIFIYGSTEDVNRRAVVELRRRYQGINIVGRANGYAAADEPNGVIEQINASGADIVFIALGSPRQENWIRDNLPRLNVKLCQGVGGTLDTIAGTAKRAPDWVQSSGLEWLYRSLHQPSRAGRVLNLFKFAALVLGAKVRG
jgi:N-acetylglucosaminyldiphosphoundecaprenol N-acetyl-beta-D-mannosaminyltransferase